MGAQEAHLGSVCVGTALLVSSGFGEVGLGGGGTHCGNPFEGFNKICTISGTEFGMLKNRHLKETERQR